MARGGGGGGGGSGSGSGSRRGRGGRRIAPPSSSSSLSLARMIRLGAACSAAAAAASASASRSRAASAAASAASSALLLPPPIRTPPSPSANPPVGAAAAAAFGARWRRLSGPSSADLGRRLLPAVVGPPPTTARPPPPPSSARFLSTRVRTEGPGDSSPPSGAAAVGVGGGDDDDDAGAGDGFFADPSSYPTFESIGVSSPVLLERVESVLCGGGGGGEGDGAEAERPRPTAVQAAAYGAISSGTEDVILGAETGSGKTLAYLLPLMDDVLRLKEGGDGRLPGYDYARAVVLVPNKELVNQVVRMAVELGGDVVGDGVGVVGARRRGFGGGGDGGGLDDEAPAAAAADVRLAVLPGGLSNPRDFRPFRLALRDPSTHPPVDILVATPASLGPMGLSPKNVDLFADVRTLVIDEADMLLDGGYSRQLGNVLTGFRRADKLARRWPSDVDGAGGGRAEDAADGEEGKGGAGGWAPPRRTQHVLVAATLPDMGLRSVDAFIRRRFPAARRITMGGMHNARHYGLGGNGTIWIEDDEDDDAGYNKVRMRKLVEMLRAPPSEEEDDDDDDGGGGGGNDGTAGILAGEKVMVFLNTVDDAEGAAGALRRAGVRCVPYHAKLSLGERTRNLGRFRRYRAGNDDGAVVDGDAAGDGADGVTVDAYDDDDDSPVPVLVCTDLASRGLDVPSVTAIVQLQFAGNVVAHLHRMGRCGRAGRRDGRGVAFYGGRERELVEVVREAERNQERMGLEGDVEEEDHDIGGGGDGDGEGGETRRAAEAAKVKGAFSRRRGFTRKRKKLRREAREAREAEEAAAGEGGY